MYCVILLHAVGQFEVEHWPELPDLVERNGVVYSKRAGPRTPLGVGIDPEQIAVYADDQLAEEEFQDLFYANLPFISELSLKFD